MTARTPVTWRGTINGVLRENLWLVWAMVAYDIFIVGFALGKAVG